MIQIIEKEFQMVQKTGPFFDLYQMVKVNEGKENEREELKLTHYGIPFETCIKNVIHHKIQDKEYSLADYVTAYEKAVKELSELIEISEDNPKKKKENAKHQLVEDNGELGQE